VNLRRQGCFFPNSNAASEKKQGKWTAKLKTRTKLQVNLLEINEIN